MSENSQTPLKLGRDRELIELVPEDEWFTVKIIDEAQLKALQNSKAKSQGDIIAVEPAGGDMAKIQVKAGKKSATMKEIRDSEMVGGGCCFHSYTIDRDKTTRYYQTDEMVVQFKAGTNIDDIGSVFHRYKLRLLRRYPGPDQAYLAQITRDSALLEAGNEGRPVEPITIARELAGLEIVDYAEADLVERFGAFYTPKDPLFAEQWHLESEAGPDVVPGAGVFAQKAWDIEQGRRSIVVAVLDDGFDLDHPDFSGKDKIVDAKDFVDGDSNPFPEGERDDYHGTACAGVAIAEQNGEGIVGIAPGCSFMPVRIPFKPNTDQMWNIFDYVSRYADVISCSWGPPPVYSPLSRLINDKLAMMATNGGPRGKGCVIVFAAGNYNTPIVSEDTEYKWVDHHDDTNISTRLKNGFASHPSVMTVSASTSLAKKSLYSNWGPEISVAAPSNNRDPLDRYAYLPGRGIWTTDNEKVGSGVTAGSRYTSHFGGTSSAAPLVAGTAALVLSVNDNLAAKDVRAILEQTADKIVDPDADPMHGHKKGFYGEKTGHSEWFGYGKINAAAAVERASNLKNYRKT